MSYRVMPFVYLNMGGEMAYILEQRLQAQNVGNDKSIKVLCDIIATMFSKSCLELIFEPQELYSKAALRQFFEQIAHSSVMRLNEASMDKLFDLMTMAVKYQVLLCKEPSELVLVTLNHLDGVKAIFKEHGHILECIDHAYTLLMDNFVETPLWEMAAVRSEVLNYLLGSRVKVSLMLREKRQLEDGRFVLFGVEGGDSTQIELPYSAVVPGTVRYFNQGEVSHVDEFPVTEQFKMSQEHQHGMAMPMMSRGTTLGHNMYRSHESTHIKGAGGTASRVGTPPAGNEVQFLQHLLQQQQQNVATFDLSLFEDEGEEKIFRGHSTDSGGKPDSEDIHKIDISANKKSLSSAVKEMKVDSKKGANSRRKVQRKVKLEELNYWK